MTADCPVCGGSTESFGTALVRATEAEYRRCTNCGSAHVREPRWLDAAHSEAISDIDVGIVDRNLRFSALTARLLRARGQRGGTFLDFGAGTGLFVRLMRDRGFDFRYLDEHPTNVFARGFEVDELSSAYDLVTAFEVLEHLPEPKHVLETLLSVSDSVLVSTLLLPDPPPRPGEWWYYATETGQHVTFYTRAGLHALAGSLGCRLVSSRDVHLFTRDRRARVRVALALRAPRWVLITRASRRSLILADQALVTAGESGEETRRTPRDLGDERRVGP